MPRMSTVTLCDRPLHLGAPSSRAGTYSLSPEVQDQIRGSHQRVRTKHLQMVPSLSLPASPAADPQLGELPWLAAVCPRCSLLTAVCWVLPTCSKLGAPY